MNAKFNYKTGFYIILCGFLQPFRAEKSMLISNLLKNIPK